MEEIIKVFKELENQLFYYMDLLILVLHGLLIYQNKVLDIYLQIKDMMFGFQIQEEILIVLNM